MPDGTPLTSSAATFSPLNVWDLRFNARHAERCSSTMGGATLLLLSGARMNSRQEIETAVADFHYHFLIARRSA